MFGFGKSESEKTAHPLLPLEPVIGDEPIPVHERLIGSQTIQTINAHDVHRGLKVGRHYATWIQERRTLFRENLDYVKVPDDQEQNVGYPNSGNARSSGLRGPIEYFISIDMAEHLALLEKNEAGHRYRQRLIDIKRAYRKNQAGLIEVIQRLEARLVQLEEKFSEANIAVLVEERFKADPRNSAITDQPALWWVEQAGALEQKRRGLVIRVSNGMRKMCKREGIAIKTDLRGTDLFPIEMSKRYMSQYGNKMVCEHNAHIAGQEILRFP